MLNTIRQAVLIAVVMLVLGPLVRLIASGMRLSDGGVGGLILSGNGGAASGFLSAILIVAIVTLAAGLGAMLRGPRHALFAAGLTMAWAAWATPGVDELFRRTRDGGVLVSLMADAIVLSVLTLIGVFGALRLSRGVPHRAHDLGPSTKATLLEVFKLASLAPLAAMVIAGVLAATVVARSPLAGQTFAAAVAAGLAGGALARIVAFPVSLGPVLIGGALVVLVGPVWGIIGAGTGANAVRAAMADALPGIAWISPWAAMSGVLVGIPLGVSWAEEIAAKQQQKQAEQKKDKSPGVRVKRASVAEQRPGV